MGSITRLWDKYKKRFFYSDAHLKMRLIATVANVFLPLALSAPQFRTDTDPICAASVSAYTNAFKAGSDVKTAMISFFKKAVEVGGSKKLSSVCDSATIAYIDALIAKKPKKKAQEAAADAYVRALTENPNGDPNGVCFEAAQELL